MPVSPVTTLVLSPDPASDLIVGSGGQIASVAGGVPQFAPSPGISRDDAPPAVRMGSGTSPLDALGVVAAATIMDGVGGLKIIFARPVGMIHRSDILASEGPQRHTRPANQRRARVYTLRVSLATRQEMDALALILADTFGGTLPVAYRHPRDDASDGLYRISNAAEGSLAISRARGGLTGSCDIVLEGLGGVAPLNVGGGAA